MSSEQPSSTRPQDETILPPPPRRLWRPLNCLLDILPTLLLYRRPLPSITTNRMVLLCHQCTIPLGFDVNSNSVQSMAPIVNRRTSTLAKPSISSGAPTSVQSLD
jgi:hypothetical protein